MTLSSPIELASSHADAPVSRINRELADDPVWQAACARYGISPSIWESLPTTKTPISPEEAEYLAWKHAQVQGEHAEAAERKWQVREALNWMTEIVRRDPAMVRRALGFADGCECLEPVVRPWYER
jgi:hypothetical protein